MKTANEPNATKKSRKKLTDDASDAMENHAHQLWRDASALEDALIDYDCPETLFWRGKRRTRQGAIDAMVRVRTEIDYVREYLISL